MFFFFGGALLRNLNKLVSEDFELKRGMILIHTYSDFFPSLRLARNQVKFFCFSAAGRAFLCPQEDLKQVVERFAWGLALNLLSVHAAQGLIIYRGRGNALSEELKN